MITAGESLLERVGPGPVAIDTACFIYFAEAHERYASLLRPLFAAADAGALQLVTSIVTLLEVLVVPYRAGANELAVRYELLLTRSRGINLVAAGAAEARLAAQLRAQYGMRTPDALQLATGLEARCTAFVTNDRAFPTIPGLPVIQLDSLVA